MTTKFTELTEIAAVDVDDDDVLALSDISIVGEGSRKVTIASLRTTVGAVELSQVQVEDDASTVFGTVSGERLGQAIQASREKSGAITATTSGTAIDFTGIPAEVQEVEVIFDEVSVSSANNFLIQVGTSSGVVTTGYTSTSIRNESGGGGNGANSTSGFVIRSGSAAFILTGSLYLRRLAAGSNVWVSNHNGKTSPDIAVQGGGRINLGAEFDRVRITNTGGDAFDAGQANVRWK